MNKKLTSFGFCQLPPPWIVKMAASLKLPAYKTHLFSLRWTLIMKEQFINRITSLDFQVCFTRPNRIY